MKRLLIISPYFPPSNAADMQRIRMSLPYFKEMGWEVEIVTVAATYSELPQDELLLQSFPATIKVHQVKAFNKSWTSKFGLGSLALRSLWFYRQKVNQLLRQTKFDLIYFSTTQFPVCVLGAYWKKHFGVPYIIDMQDPWHSDYYQDKPKSQQPAKYWFSYRLNKYLEPIAIKQASGLISVSEKYIDDLKERYPSIKKIPAATITFGAFVPDLEIANRHRHAFKPTLQTQFTNIVYIGRGGWDMYPAIKVLFETLKNGLDTEPASFSKIRAYFIGTSYAPNGQGTPTIQPLAKQFGIESNVIELTDRISYYHTLLTLQQADALFIPGSDDPRYTASKIYPYLLTKRPLFAILHSNSPANAILAEYGVNEIYNYDRPADAGNRLYHFLKQAINHQLQDNAYNVAAEKNYSAENMTRKQCELFERALEKQN